MNETSYNLDVNNQLMFSTRKNKKTDLTEFYKLIYQYKNDCLERQLNIIKITTMIESLNLKKIYF